MGFFMKRKRMKELRRRYPSYYRIHTWIESRIGPLSADDADLERKLLDLLERERRRGADVRGMEAYIRSNAYRRMFI